MKSIVIFASGNGTNAENIIRFFKESKAVIVQAIFTNNPKAGVIVRAQKLSVPVFVFNREMLYKNGEVFQILCRINPDLVVLAGFLWKIPMDIIATYPNKIINIHPALLPYFGGKGMYGMQVHEAVIAAKVPESGITIHYVNEKYDQGNIIFQFKYTLSKNETPESLAQKIHRLEYTHYPKVIKRLLEKM